MGKWCLHASLFLGNKDMFKNYKRFDFWHVQTADLGGTKPWKNNCSLIWKLFKFLMTFLAGLFEMKGCWHIGLRWAIVVLWATCCHMRTTKAQISLRIHAVWSAPLFLLPRQCNISSFYIGNFMTPASFFSRADQFESYLFENPEDRFSRDEAHIISNEEILMKEYLSRFAEKNQ